MIKKNFKIKTKIITSLPNNLRNKFNIETCYSGAYSEAQNKIVFPSTNTGEIFIYELSNEFKVKDTIKLSLPPNVKPDIAIFKNDEIIVGCRDTFPPVVINSEYKVNKLFLSKNIFYPTCFKLSPLGQLFIGNLYGEPCILNENKVSYLPIKGTQTYDCIWLSEENLLISSTWENRLIHLLKIKNKWIVKNSYPIIQPYRFSPVVNDNFLLTTRGWVDRPGKVHLFNVASLNSYEPKHFKPKSTPGLKKSIVIPNKFFFLKKNIPTNLLSIFNQKRYTGYINDVAWITENYFVVTTKYGGKLIVFDLEGKIISIKSQSYASEITRFIDSRYPSNLHLFVDAYRSSVNSFESSF